MVPEREYIFSSNFKTFDLFALLIYSSVSRSVHNSLALPPRSRTRWLGPSRPDHKRSYSTSCCFSTYPQVWLTWLGEASCHVMGTVQASGRTHGEEHDARTCVCCASISILVSPVSRHQLGSTSYAPGKPSSDCAPKLQLHKRFQNDPTNNS